MRECQTPLAAAYAGMREVEILEQIRNTELQETCGYVGVRET